MGCCANNREKGRGIKILILGPDESGKTTFAYSLDGIEDLGPYIPTDNLQIYDIDRTPFKVQFYEIGGAFHLRSQWYDNLLYCDGIFFVIDVSDDKQLKEGLSELRKLVKDKRTQSYPIFIYFNKTDKGLAVKKEELKKEVEEIMAERKTFNRTFFVSSLNQNSLGKSLDAVLAYFFPSCILLEPKRNSAS